MSNKFFLSCTNFSKEQGACEGVMKSNQQEVTTDRFDYNIPSNVDFTCYQNVKNRFKALYLLAKLALGSDKGHRYLVMDRGSRKTLDVYPRQFLWEGILKSYLKSYDSTLDFMEMK